MKQLPPALIGNPSLEAKAAVNVEELAFSWNTACQFQTIGDKK